MSEYGVTELALLSDALDKLRQLLNMIDVHAECACWVSTCWVDEAIPVVYISYEIQET